MEIRLYATLRPLAGGSRVTVPAADGEAVGEVLRRLVAEVPGLQGAILDQAGSGLVPYVNVFIAGRSIRDLDGLQTRVKATDDLAVFPPVAGG